MKIPSFITHFPWLSAKFPSLLAIPLLLGLVWVPTLSAVAAPFTFHEPASGLQLMSVVSRKIHGTAGPSFDINLPLSGTRGIECRSGNHTLVFTFNNTLTSVASVNATATGATQPGQSSGSIDPNDAHNNIAGVDASIDSHI